MKSWPRDRASCTAAMPSVAVVGAAGRIAQPQQVGIAVAATAGLQQRDQYVAVVDVVIAEVEPGQRWIPAAADGALGGEMRVRVDETRHQELAEAVTKPDADGRDRVLAATTGVFVLGFSLGYGAWRLLDYEATTGLRVGLPTIGGSGDTAADPSTTEGRLMLSRYVAEIDRLAADGAEVVVAPESALLLRSHALEALQELSTRHDMRILIGAEDHSDPLRFRSGAFSGGRVCRSIIGSFSSCQIRNQGCLAT